MQCQSTLSQLAMSGRKMYSLTSQVQMGKKGLTPKLRPRGEDVTMEGACINGHSAATKSKVKDSDDGSSEGEVEVKKKIETKRVTRRSKQQAQLVTSSGNEEIVRTIPKATPSRTTRRSKRQEIEEEMVVTAQKTPAQVTGKSNKIISSSESNLSEVSEDEELILLAAKLNRGEIAGGAADENTLEDYFSAHSGSAGLTSDHTLAKLACPKMDQRSVQNALNAISSSYQKDCQALYKEYTALYSYWLHLLANGYNVLLYGLGSKHCLLEDFRKKYLQDFCHFVVNGYFPGLTMKQILNSLSSDLIGHSGSFKSLIDHASFVCDELEDRHIASPDQGPSKKLFVIIHNIDGPMLRGDTLQTVLSLLAQSHAIHVIASIDHINAPLIWDQRKLSKFNWLWHDVTTYEFYRHETSYENSLLVQQSGTLALSSLTNVTKSLTPNARGIFELLVKYQLEHKTDKEGTYLGMSFHDLYLKCREKFLVNSDMTLRAQLTEFRDHKLVRSRKGSDGVEYLLVSIDNGTLEEFLEQQKDS